jgi:hypothetical protein
MTVKVNNTVWLIVECESHTGSLPSADRNILPGCSVAAAYVSAFRFRCTSWNSRGNARTGQDAGPMQQQARTCL